MQVHPIIEKTTLGFKFREAPDEVSALHLPALPTGYTFQASDNGLTYMHDSTSATAPIVPNNLPRGFTVSILTWGTGLVTPTAASGTTKRGSGSVSVQYGFIQIFVGKNTSGTGAEFVVLGGA